MGGNDRLTRGKCILLDGVLKMQDNWRWVAYEKEVRRARRGCPRRQLTGERLQRSLRYGGLMNDSDTTFEKRIRNKIRFLFCRLFLKFQI